MNNPKVDIPVALYTRVSTEEQKENFSLAAQLELLRKYASDNGYLVFDEYVDGGYSGTSYDRPAFQKLLDDANKRKFKIVLVYKLDRFFRNNRALLTVADDLEKNGVGIKSITEPFDTSNHLGKFILSLFGSLAQLERDTFMERSKLGRLRRAREGYYSGTNPTKFGYIYNPETRKLEIHEKEAEAIKLVFRIYNEPDSSLVKVAKRLNEMGYKTKEGNTFTSDGIHDVVRDPIYTGRWYANRYGRKGKLKPREEWIEVQVPALISLAIFDKTQELLIARRNYTVRNVKYQYLLQGMVKCGDCGNSVSGTADRQFQVRNGKKYGPYFKLYYRCTHFVKNVYEKKVKCRLRYMQGERLETVVWNEVEKILEDPSLIAQAVDFEKEHGGQQKKQLDKELAKIELRQNSIQTEEQRILEAYRHNIITIAQLENEMNKIKEDREILKNKHNELSNLLAVQNNKIDIDEVIMCVKKVREGLQKFTYEAKKNILNFFQARIVAHITGIIDLFLTFPKNLSEISFPSDSANVFSWSPLQGNISLR